MHRTRGVRVEKEIVTLQVEETEYLRHFYTSDYVKLDGK